LKENVLDNGHHYRGRPARYPFWCDDEVYHQPNVEARMQHIEQSKEKYGAILGMTTKSLPAGLLSGRIYKIYTILSTDIVENTSPRARGTAREALLGAVLATWADSPWYGVDDAGMVTR